jgi:hypothetical protein
MSELARFFNAGNQQKVALTRIRKVGEKLMATAGMKETIRFQYENTMVTITALKALDEFKTQDATYGPVEKGREILVPRWVANILISSNLARLVDPGIKVAHLQKTLWQETGEPVLQSLDPDFYYQVRSSIEHLTDQNKTSPNDVRLAAQSKMEQLFRDILDSRILKIMKLSLREERLRETKKKMTEEERWLFDRLVNLLRNWKTEVLETETGD